MVRHGDGRLEMQDARDYSRMAVCADQGWNTSEIAVACRQIGFQGAGKGTNTLTLRTADGLQILFK